MSFTKETVPSLKSNEGKDDSIICMSHVCALIESKVEMYILSDQHKLFWKLFCLDGLSLDASSKLSLRLVVHRRSTHTSNSSSTCHHRVIFLPSSPSTSASLSLKRTSLHRQWKQHPNRTGAFTIRNAFEQIMASRHIYHQLADG